MRFRHGVLQAAALSVGIAACSQPADPGTDVVVPVDAGGLYIDINPGSSS